MQRLTTILIAATYFLAPDCANGKSIFTETFDAITNGTVGTQYQTGLQLTAFADLPGWTKAGLHAVHGVMVTPGNWALQIYDANGGYNPNNNAVTLNTSFAANSSNVTYHVTFDAGPTVWAAANPEQATGSTDQLQIQLIDPLNNVVAGYMYTPGAWAGSQTLRPAGFVYTGTGTGDLRFVISGNTAPQRFAGAIDNLAVSTNEGIASWTGENSATWSDGGNWTGAVPGAINDTTNGDTAVFDQNAPNSPLTIDAGRNIQNFNFDTASVNSLTIGSVGGPALLLTAGGTIHTMSTVVNSQTVNAPLVLEGDYTFTSDASNGSATLSFGGGITPAPTGGVTTLTLNGSNTGSNTISGALADNAAGQLAVTKSGTGIWILSGANTYSGGTTISGGTLKFNIRSGTPTISAGATATVAADATLELAGSVSALGTAGGNRTHILNNSTALGLVVSGTSQVVGGIDGAGNTQVNAGSDLTADHIIQSALAIGGTAGNPGLVTIDVSDADGNPPTGGLSLAGSLALCDPSGAGIASPSLLGGGVGNVASSAGSEFTTGNLIAGAGSAAVPEPSTLALAGCGLAIAAAVNLRRRRSKRQTNH